MTYNPPPERIFRAPLRESFEVGFGELARYQPDTHLDTANLLVRDERRVNTKMRSFRIERWLWKAGRERFRYLYFAILRVQVKL